MQANQFQDQAVGRVREKWGGTLTLEGSKQQLDRKRATVSLRQELVRRGCSEEFAKRALVYEPVFSGDVEKFVQDVTQILEREDTSARTPRVPPATLDEGVKQAALDYDGDLLAHLGYR